MSNRTLLLIVALAGCAASIPTVFGQDAPASASTTAPASPRAPDPARQLKHLTRQLGLTADQAARIGPILSNRQQQMAALRADGGLSGADRRAKRESIQQQAQAAIDAVLTDAQRAQYQQARAAAMDKRSQRHAAPAEATSAG